MIDPKMEQAAIDLWEDISKSPAVISVGAGKTLLVYLKKGFKKPEIPSTWKGFEVVTKAISVPLVTED